MMHASSSEKIPIAISSCLLGQAVRYDGGHKHNAYLTETLGRYFDYTGFCPEVEIGLGIPRPPIQLVQINDTIRARGVSDPQHDVTEQLQEYACSVASMLNGYGGYIFKSASPSCGMECVKVYENGHLVGTDRGIYAAAIMQALPALPVEEESRLMDRVLRENFIERVFIYHRWEQFIRRGLSAATLAEFHTRLKVSLYAHDETIYRNLGQRIVEVADTDLETFADEYIQRIMKALSKPAKSNISSSSNC